MPVPINHILNFQSPLLEKNRTYKERPLEKVVFLTVSCKEATKNGYTVLVDGDSIIEELLYEETEDGAFFLDPETKENLGKARGYTIVDWKEEEDERGLPLASLTTVILYYAGGDARKAGEITMGEISPATFKFLQQATINQILNELI